MNRSRLTRWAAVLALAVLGTTTASAQEAGTITITGTLKMDELYGGGDVAAVFANGNEHTWSLTLYDTTYSHWGSGSYRATNVSASSFDLEFSGPDAEVLNAIVSEQLAGGVAYLELGHNPDYTNAALSISLWNSESGAGFWTQYDWSLAFTTFPSDQYGYPIVESEPFSIYAEQVWAGDAAGYIISWDNTLTIAGDLGTPIPASVRIGDAGVVEGNRGSSQVALQVTLRNTSDETITVDYRTIDGTAVSVGGKRVKADYSAASGTLTFQPGETMKTITISVKSDRTREGDETFTVELFNAGTTVEDGVATVTIRNDD